MEVMAITIASIAALAVMLRSLGIPARLADTPVDYESLRDVGAIMGSGGMVVLDDTACMVDIARYFLQFTQDQSCGKCTFCRIGTKRMLEILGRITSGQGVPEDIEKLERLAPVTPRPRLSADRVHHERPVRLGKGDGRKNSAGSAQVAARPLDFAFLRA